MNKSRFLEEKGCFMVKRAFVGGSRYWSKKKKKVLCSCGGIPRYRIRGKDGGGKVLVTFCCGLCLHKTLDGHFAFDDRVSVFDISIRKKCGVDSGCGYWSCGKCIIHKCVLE